MIVLLLDHGANPAQVQEGLTAIARAARRGRGDVLDVFAKRGIPPGLEGVDRLIAACATHDADAVRAIAASEPQAALELLAMGKTLIANFAGTWNTEGVALLLDLGVPVDGTHEGDGYFGTPANSTALHVAAWRGVATSVKLLIARGANVHAVDGQGRTPLMLAVKAAVDSYWTYRRTPEAVKALLEAGASVSGVRYPSGYADVDALLEAHGAV